MAARLAEALTPVPLPLPGGRGSTDTCELLVVGIFHREPASVRLVREVVVAAAGGAGATAVDAVAVEARPSFLHVYDRLAGAVAPELLRQLQAMPLDDLQAALDYVTLQDRLAWHASLVDANQRLTAAVAASSSAALASGGGAAAAAAAAAATASSSALDAIKLLSAFLGRELVLAEKVSCASVAHEMGLPLHGIELDDPKAYAALLGGQQLGRLRDAAGATRGSIGGLQELEAEQRRLALGVLRADVADAFRGWLDRVPHDHSLRGPLQAQLANLIQQAMDPQQYEKYVDATQAMWTDEQRAGPALAAQHAALTVQREAHFLERLQQVALEGAAGGGACRRVVVVLGRTHAARMRRALLAQGR